MAFSAALILVALALASPADADLVAGRIGGRDPSGWSLGGPDRDAGQGDWALGNGTICAAVSDPAHEGMMYPTGGVLVDVGFCGREDDQWTTLEMMWNLSRDTNLIVSHVEAGRDEDRAWILTRGARDGVQVETRYELDRAEPRALQIRLRLTRVEEGPSFFAASLITLHPTGQTRPFSLFRAAPEKSAGFAYPASDPNSTLSLLRAIIPVDLHVFVGPEGAPGIAYGLEQVRAERVDESGDAPRMIPTMATTGADSSLTGFFSEPFWIGEGDPPGLLELAQTVFMDLDLGDRLELDWRLWVGDRADVASVTDYLWAEHPLVRGVVDDPAARIHVDTVDGTPVTEVRVDHAGRFALRVPPGHHLLTIRSLARPDVVREVRVEEEDVDVGRIAVGAPATVELPRGRRMRLAFEGIDGTADPVFGDDLLELRVGDERISTTQETRDVVLGGTERDPANVVLPPGRYRVTATRGPEFGVEQTEITVPAGTAVRLELAEPLRALETPGWIGADLHVHTGRSFDTAWPVERQFSGFAAEGAEVLVATEHDRVFDPRPVLAELGFDDAIVGVPGVEVTSVAATDAAPHTLGHMNAFPIEQTSEYRGGAPAGEGRRLRDVLADTNGSGALRQLNHPRTSGRARDGAYFTHLSVPGEPFAPAKPLSEEPNRVLVDPDPKTGVRDLDFEAIEGMNGEDTGAYRMVRADWFSLLLQGERRTLTANSDSHRASQPVALPRTYVRAERDRVKEFDREAFIEALREGRAFGTTGPILEVELEGAGLGDTHTGPAGRLVVTVRAAPWVPVDEVRVYVDGGLAARRPATLDERLEFPLEFARDGFVTVEVEGRPSTEYAAVAPGFVPFAFTNPIFVDADADGAWTPPGLEDVPATITSPDEVD